MNRALCYSFLLNVIFACAYAGTRMDSSNATETQSTCPQTFESWGQWRQGFAMSLPPWKDAQQKFKDAIQVLDRCKAEANQSAFFANDEFKACMANLRATAETMSGFVFSEGGEISRFTDEIVSQANEHPLKGDATYRSFMAPFSDSNRNLLLRNYDLGNTWKLRGGLNLTAEREQKVKEYLEQLPKGARAISYQSGTVHRGGIVFVLPGNEQGANAADHYAHIDASNGEVLQLSIRKRDAAGKVLDPPEILFDTGSTGPTEGPRKQIGRCMYCHRSGAWPIMTDRPESVVSYTDGLPSDQALSWFNTVQIPKTANAVPSGFSWERVATPSYGQGDSPLRTDEFVETCVRKENLEAAVPRLRTQKIKEAMNCTRCHDGANAGLINYPFASDETSADFLRQIIKHGLMPPKSDLTSDERKVLGSCLREEYFAADPSGKQQGAFARHLLQTSCPSGSTGQSGKSACDAPPKRIDLESLIGASGRI